MQVYICVLGIHCIHCTRSRTGFSSRDLEARIPYLKWLNLACSADEAHSCQAFAISSTRASSCSPGREAVWRSLLGLCIS